MKKWRGAIVQPGVTDEVEKFDIVEAEHAFALDLVFRIACKSGLIVTTPAIKILKKLPRPESFRDGVCR